MTETASRGGAEIAAKGPGYESLCPLRLRVQMKQSNLHEYIITVKKSIQDDETGNFR
jgi:hypothetical protein